MQPHPFPTTTRPHAAYDLVVLGSGPAGQKAALCAAKLGRRVAVVDRRDSVGGVCIHTGTVPSKAIREAALHFSGVKYRELYGHDYAVKDHITMDDLLQRAHHVSRSEAGVIKHQMRRNGIAHISGLASFVDPHTLLVTDGDDEHHVTAAHVLIACGARPARPASVPFTRGRVIDSDEILQLKELPREMCIVGGGVIGTEYASMLSACGVRVTLVEGKPRLLDFLDEEISESLQYRLRECGVRLRLGEKVDHIDVADGPGRRKGDPTGVDVPRAGRVTATLCSGKTVGCDTLLYCIGREGATAGMNLEAAGLQADSRGRVSVNAQFQTDVPHIYAAGDVVGFPALAATSMEQGRHAALHMFAPAKLDADAPAWAAAARDAFPYGIYTIPEISMIGQTERQLTDAQVPFEVGIARYKEIARGQLMGDTHGLIKLLFHAETRTLLGIHAIGTGSTELIHIGQVAMAAALPVDYFAEAIFNYPTLAECYKVAAMDGLNRVRGHCAAPESAETPEAAELALAEAA